MVAWITTVIQFFNFDWWFEMAVLTISATLGVFRFYISVSSQFVVDNVKRVFSSCILGSRLCSTQTFSVSKFMFYSIYYNVAKQRDKHQWANCVLCRRGNFKTLQLMLHSLHKSKRASYGFSVNQTMCHNRRGLKCRCSTENSSFALSWCLSRCLAARFTCFVNIEKINIIRLS